MGLIDQYKLNKKKFIFKYTNQIDLLN